MVADWRKQVKIEQNRNQCDCLHQPISIIKNPAMKIAVRAADAGEITQDATSPVPALVKK